jgi:hypothetical protein
MPTAPTVSVLDDDADDDANDFTVETSNEETDSESENEDRIRISPSAGNLSKLLNVEHADLLDILSDQPCRVVNAGLQLQDKVPEPALASLKMDLSSFDWDV